MIGVSADPLASTQAMLPISLIATPRADLFTCNRTDRIRDVIARYADFDHIPVTEDGRPESRFLGLLDTHRFRDRETDASVGDLFAPLCEEQLIGSDAPIIEFVRDAPERDCRLLVSGKNISGLVTLSDLQALPVRAALFALVTRLELVMTERIKEEFVGLGEAWKDRLSGRRRRKLQEQIKSAKDGDSFVNELLCTQFADKVTIISRAPDLPASRTKFARDLSSAQKLRDALAHANEYASTRTKALQVCATVQRISFWIEHLA